MSFVRCAKTDFCKYGYLAVHRYRGRTRSWQSGRGPDVDTESAAGPGDRKCVSLCQAALLNGWAGRSIGCGLSKIEVRWGKRPRAVQVLSCEKPLSVWSMLIMVWCSE